MDNKDNLVLKSLSSDEINKIEEFRKSKHTAVLAILFSDIVNSTYASEKLGEQTYSKLRHIHDELFTQIMTRDNAGVIIKQIGDSFLCVFAEPSTSVLRAVEFQRTIRQNKDNLTINDYTLIVRIGIHIGQVVVENKLSMDIFGSQVNRAARIESIANGGQILTSQSIWENAVGWLKDNNEEEIGWISYGKTRLKGIDGKIEIFGFYSKENGPSSTPKVFLKQRKKRALLGLTVIVLVAFLSFFLVKIFNSKSNKKVNIENTSGRKSYYIQFDFSETPNLDTSLLNEIFLSEMITAMYPDSILTENDLIHSLSKQGKLYKRHANNNFDEGKYFSDTLHLFGAVSIKSIRQNNKITDTIAYYTKFQFWYDGGSTVSDDTLLSSIKDLKNNFRNWIQKRITEFRIKDELGVVLESNDSIVLFQIAKEAKPRLGASLSFRRQYVNKEGLAIWLSEYNKKFAYLKDKPQFSEQLKKEKLDFEKDSPEITYDLTNTKGGWMIKLKDIESKVTELYDSVGKATWVNKGIYPFVKPKKGDLIFLDY